MPIPLPVTAATAAVIDMNGTLNATGHLFGLMELPSLSRWSGVGHGGAAAPQPSGPVAARTSSGTEQGSASGTVLEPHHTQEFGSTAGAEAPSARAAQAPQQTPWTGATLASAKVVAPDGLPQALSRSAEGRVLPSRPILAVPVQRSTPAAAARPAAPRPMRASLGAALDQGTAPDALNPAHWARAGIGGRAPAPLAPSGLTPRAQPVLSTRRSASKQLEFDFRAG